VLQVLARFRDSWTAVVFDSRDLLRWPQLQQKTVLVSSLNVPTEFKHRPRFKGYILQLDACFSSKSTWHRVTFCLLGLQPLYTVGIDNSKFNGV
jgi:hypothetical protein